MYTVQDNRAATPSNHVSHLYFIVNQGESFRVVPHCDARFIDGYIILYEYFTVSDERFFVARTFMNVD